MDQSNKVQPFVYKLKTGKSVEPCGFSEAVTVWINKPHVANKRLCGSIINWLKVKKKDKEPHFELFCNEVIARLDLDEKQNSEGPVEGNQTLLECPPLSTIQSDEILFGKRTLFHKNAKKYPDVQEFFVYDAEKVIVNFWSKYPQHRENNVSDDVQLSFCYIPYSLRFEISEERGIVLEIKSREKWMLEDEYESKLHWMKETLLPKICNWSKEAQLKTSVTSLRLVRVDEYNTLYNELKEKYGKPLVKNWTEKTDPQKFVFEDIAIAAYLLLIWKQQRSASGSDRMQSFVDLGCGNGLLVYILSAEGHPGVGLDLRKRNIWDLYKDMRNGSSTNLQVKSIVPSWDTLFPEYDWFIGNHSDELTPWIPVMAARSSYHCCFFVLPCCHHDFDRKFDEKVTGESSYQSYLNFVHQVGEVCGFEMEEDVLRIPSTKRVCFIGKTRTYSIEEETAADKKRSEFISCRCQRSKNENGSQSDSRKRKLEAEKSSWSENFVPREKEEKSRNCGSVKKEVKELIVHSVFTKLLEMENGERKILPDGRVWRKGGVVPLGDIVTLFDDSTMKELKSECGGLQTLLRNHNSIFQVSGGKVQLRDLTLDAPFSKKSKLRKLELSAFKKTVLCWFHGNHPDGCPLSADSCRFAHGVDDLRQFTGEEKS